MKKMINIVHDIITSKPHYHHSVDFTMGNGSDTLLLASISDYVDAFDIQKAAIQHTKQRLCFYDNVIYHETSHEYAKDILKEPIDLGVFNFGYLPGGNEHITTMLSSSAKAVQDASAFLSKGGYLILTIYPGHPQGKKEAVYFDAWASRLSKEYRVMKLCVMNKQHAPYILWIEKSTHLGC